MVGFARLVASGCLRAPCREGCTATLARGFPVATFTAIRRTHRRGATGSRRAVRPRGCQRGIAIGTCHTKRQTNQHCPSCESHLQLLVVSNVPKPERSSRSNRNQPAYTTANGQPTGSVRAPPPAAVKRKNRFKLEILWHGRQIQAGKRRYPPGILRANKQVWQATDWKIGPTKDPGSGLLLVLGRGLPNNTE